MPLLDLTGADLSGFEAIPSGTYHAEVFSAKLDKTKGGPNSKLPAGTPMIKVQFKILGSTDDEGNTIVGEESPYYNRRVFSQYVIGPYPKNYDKQKVATMKGVLVKFLMAIGYTEEELISEEFDLTPDDMQGRSCRVVVRKKVKYGVNPDADDFNSEDPDNYDNEVTNVKSASEAVAVGGSGLT